MVKLSNLGHSLVKVIQKVMVLQESMSYKIQGCIQGSIAYNSQCHTIGQLHTTVKVIQGSIAYNSQGHTRVKVTIRF